MSARPIRPGQGPRPEDQIGVPRPPLRSDPDFDTVDRRLHADSVADSYRKNLVRIWPQGRNRPAVDVVPTDEAAGQGPDQLFGTGCGPVYVISGNHAFGRLTTLDDDARSLGTLHWRLNFDARHWVPAVTTSPMREWVEQGAAVVGCSEEEALSQARRLGQRIVLRWDADGLYPVPVKGGDLGVHEPVPVCVRPALTGCPLRLGADGVCKMDGGPWTSSSITAAFFWQQHRRLLVQAFGCDVCEGDGGEGPRGAVDLFTPSREGGWQRALPMTAEEMRARDVTSGPDRP